MISNTEGITRSTLVANSFPNLDYSNGEECLKLIYNNYIQNYSWTFAYKMSVVRKYGMQYDTHYSFLEDMLMLNTFLRNNLTVAYINKALYLYRINNESISHVIDYKYVKSAYEVLEKVSDMCIMDGSISSYANSAVGILQFTDDFGVLRKHPELDKKRRQLFNKLIKYISHDQMTFKNYLMFTLYRLHLYSPLISFYRTKIKSMISPPLKKRIRNII